MKINQQTMQLIKYTLIGISSTVIQYIIYLLCYTPTKNYIFANIVAFIISVFNSYYWNRKLIFNTTSTVWWKVLLKNYILYFGTGVILTNIFAYVMIDVWNISPYLSPLIIVIIIYPLNYVLNRFWAHKGDEDNASHTV